MIRHDEALALAATALDFGLSPAERAELDAHLAACAACAADARAMRGDLSALSNVPVAPLDPRRADDLLATALAPARSGTGPLRLVLVGALIALLALGSIIVGSILLEHRRPDVSIVVPAPSPAASAAVDPTPAPSALASGKPVGVAVDLARIVCGTDPMTSLLTPVVRARADGVHIEATNATGTDRSIALEDVGGDNAPVGVSETVWRVGPGAARIRCIDPGLDAGTDAGWVTLTIVDPESHFRSTELGCSDQTIGTFDYVEGAPGRVGDPVSLTKAAVTGLRPGDAVEAAGYPEAAERLVRIVRDGRVVALFAWGKAQDGGWLLYTQTNCGGTGIALRSTE